MSATACPDTCDSWDFAARYFGDCVCSRRDALSFVLGCVSIVAWGVAELPQIVANWRNRSSEGVSLAFIATWLTGDAFNLVGCAVSPTLPTQLYTAMLYTSTTVVLIAQHLHYNNRRSDAATKRETEGAEDVHGRYHRLGDIENGEGDVWNDDAARGTDARPLLGRHRRDASGDASDDENKSSASAAAFESVGSNFGTTPGSARTFALLGSVPHPSGSHSGSHPRAARSHGRVMRLGASGAAAGSLAIAVLRGGGGSPAKSASKAKVGTGCKAVAHVRLMPVVAAWTNPVPVIATPIAAHTFVLRMIFDHHRSPACWRVGRPQGAVSL